MMSPHPTPTPTPRLHDELQVDDGWAADSDSADSGAEELLVKVRLPMKFWWCLEARAALFVSGG